MATAADRTQLAAAVDATLVDQARRNELTIAWLRAGCLPVFDALLIACALGARFFVESGSLTTIALLCALLSPSGAFRLSRAAMGILGLTPVDTTAAP
jgi:hypothetical protein